MTVGDPADRTMRDTYDYVIVGTGCGGQRPGAFTTRHVVDPVGGYRYAPRGVPGRETTAPVCEPMPPPTTRPRSAVPSEATPRLWSGKVYLPTPQEMKDWPVGFEELRRFSAGLAERFGVPHSWLHDIRQHASGAVLHRSYRSNWGKSLRVFEPGTCAERRCPGGTQPRRPDKLTWAGDVHRTGFESRAPKDGIRTPRCRLGRGRVGQHPPVVEPARFQPANLLPAVRLTVNSATTSISTWAAWSRSTSSPTY